MGITDVTAGGAAPVRVETPQVSSPAPQRAPKPEVKAPVKAATQSTAVKPAAPNAADVVVQSGVQHVTVPKAQNGNLTRAAKEDAQNGRTGERVIRQQGASGAGGLPARNVQRATGQQEEQKTAEQDSYYEKIMAEKAMENAEERLRALRHNVRFGYNDEIERYTITITDADDKEVKKEIPSEEIQKMIEHLHTMRGMMFDTEI